MHKKYITIQPTAGFNFKKLLRMDEIGNEIDLNTIPFDTKTGQEDLLAQTPNTCISSITNIETV